LLYQYFSF